MLNWIFSLLILYHPPIQPLPPTFQYGEVDLVDLERISFDMVNSCAFRPDCRIFAISDGFHVMAIGYDRQGNPVRFQMQFKDGHSYTNFADELPKWQYFWEITIGSDWQ